MKTKHTSPFLYSDGFKRYYTLDYYYKQIYRQKMCKIPLSAGFSCPNRDGSKGVGGCSYCSGAGGGEFALSDGTSLLEQYWQQQSKFLKKWPQAGFIAYFQTFSNTYGPLSRVEAILNEALALPEVRGISLATRADCIDQGVTELLAKTAEKIPLTVELGLQTVHDATAKRLNRCHDYQDFLLGYTRLKQKGIRVCLHLINGLPGETAEMMVETVKTLSKQKPDGIKFHMLHLLKGTGLAKEYLEHPFNLLTRDAYIQILCDQLEWLPQSCVVERISGDGMEENLLAPLWTQKKLTVLNELDKELYRRNSYQGRRLEEKDGWNFTDGEGISEGTGQP